MCRSVNGTFTKGAAASRCEGPSRWDGASQQVKALVAHGSCFRWHTMYQWRFWHCHRPVFRRGSIFGNEPGSLPCSLKHCYYECCIWLNVLARHGERHAGLTEHNQPWQSKTGIKTLASVLKRVPDSPMALCVVHVEWWIPSKSDLKLAYVAKWGAAQTYRLYNCKPGGQTVDALVLNHPE